MGVSICICGHARGSHLIRWGLEDTVRAQVASGDSACRECVCSWYTVAVEVAESDRRFFRAKQKRPRGNMGANHPFMLGLSKANRETTSWHAQVCGDCGVALSAHSAILLDSRFYCGSCLIQHPEVYLGTPDMR